MAEIDNSRARIAELRERWEADTSSRLFLQLAEEYRRLGSPREAIPILESGLQHHPTSGAAHVALGRCHLEAGMSGEGAEILEGVVRRDPTQMVAYRSLVDAYIDLGQIEPARDRLGLYAQLNPQDPDIEELARQIDLMDDEGERDSSGAPAPSSSPLSEADLDPAVRALEGASDAEATELERLAAGSPPQSSDEPARAGVAREGESSDDAIEPSGQEHSPAKEREASKNVVADELAEDVLAAEAPKEKERADQGPADSQESSWGSRLDEAALGVPGVLGAVAIDPLRLPPPSLDRLVARPLASPRWFCEGSGESGPKDSGGNGADAPRQREESHEVSRRTATLGSLYLRQGYAEEAKEIFEEVLGGTKDHHQAQRGLRAASGEGLTAGDLLRDLGDRELGQTQKKVHLLKAYMARLRGQSGDGHVS